MKVSGIILSLGMIIISWSGFKGSDLVETNIPQKRDADIFFKICDMNNKLIGREYSCSVTEGVPLPDGWARGGHAGGMVDGIVVVAGGNNWSKDKTTKYWLKNSVLFKDGSWIPGPEMPGPLAYAMYAYDKSGLYVAGGTSDGTSVSADVYRLSSLKKGNGWESLPLLPEALNNGAGAILNGRFYVACGSAGTKKTNRMWYLNLNKKTGTNWTECKPLPGAGRMFPSLVACGKYLYLLGGLAETSPLTPLNDFYRYDPAANEWTKLKDLPFKGYAWVSQPVDDRNIIITGRADGTIHKGIWIIDTEDVSVREAGSLVIASTTAPLIRIGEKQWWLIGGEPDANKNRTEKVNVIRLK
jgi:N-acetylneuraminic acid mutarotase